MHIATANIVDAVSVTISIITLKKDGLGLCLVSMYVTHSENMFT